MDNQGEDKNLWQPDENQPAADQPAAKEEPAVTDLNAPKNNNSESSATNAENPKDVDSLEIRWTAGDSIDHHRSKTWYIVVIAVVVVISVALAALAFFKIFSLTTTITTELLVIVMMIALFVVTRQPPREVNYILTDAGLTIDGKLHPFSEFRAFGVQKIGAMWQLVLVPVKRFGMSTTMFIHQDQGERIVDELGARLPMEEVKVDVVDNLINKLKI